MAILSITSGPISYGDLRTHLGGSGAVSASDFRNGNQYWVPKPGIKATNLSDAYVSDTDTYWELRTLQVATASNGGGTVTTSYGNFSRYKRALALNLNITNNTTTSKTYSNNQTDFIAIDGFLSDPEMIDGVMTINRGTLKVAGTYSSWEDNVDAKGNFVNSTRTKSDYYGITISDGKRYTNYYSLNPGLKSGNVKHSELYGFDDGVILDTTFSSNTGDASAGYLRTAGNTISYGDITNDTTTSRLDRANDLIVTGAHLASNFRFFYRIPVTRGEAFELAHFTHIIVNGVELELAEADLYDGEAWDSTHINHQFYWDSANHTLPTITTPSTGNTLKLIMKE